jgi:hypothetical protein
LRVGWRKTPAPAAVAHAPTAVIRDTKGPYTPYTSGTINGRKLTLLSTVADYIENGGHAAYNHQRVYRLVDETGKEILPLGVAHARLIPDRSVYVLPAKDRLRFRRDAFHKAISTGYAGQKS